MRETKIVAFSFPVKTHADLKARLLYDGVPMTKFIRHCIQAYLDKDKDMLDFVEKYKVANGIDNKKKRTKTRKLIEKGKKITELFNLTGKEIDNIYDILEEEIGGFPEL